MTTFPNSPRLLKGAIVGVDTFNPLASVIIFQYNPDTLTRRLQARTLGGEDEGARSEALRLTGPPQETISLDVEVDATDQLERADSVATSMGVYPQHAAWTRALDRLPLQAKLTINQPGDPYEQAADQVAAHVMRMPDLRVQRRCACGGVAGPDGECEACKAKRLGVQRASDAAGGMPAPASVQQTLRAPGQPLDPATRAFMESRFGRDFGGVRVHTDAQAAESAQAGSAHAYTVGQNVVFANGRHAPRCMPKTSGANPN